MERPLNLRTLPVTALSTLAIALGVAACAAPEEEAPAAEAVAQVEQIPVTTDSDSARALLEEGRYLLDVGRNVQAREKFKAAIEEDPGFVRAYYDQSNAALSFREFQAALDTAAEHLDQVSEGERMLVEINRTFLTNDPQSGLELASELAARYPDSPRAHVVLAGMQTNQNDAEAARRSYARALELDPDSPAALFGMATSYLFSEPKDFAAAEEWARKSIAAYPDEAKAYELLGDVKRAQDDLEAAREAYNEAAVKDPQLAAAQHKKGHVNSFLGNIEEARASYDAGVAVAKPEAKAGLAAYKTFTRIHQGDIPAALDEMEALVGEMEEMGTPAEQLAGNRVFVYNNHATAAMHAGLLDRAAVSVAAGNELRMQIAADVGTDDARRLQEAACHTWDGLLAAYKGDEKGATENADAITALVAEDDNPRKMEPVHWVLGMSALQQESYDQAVEHLRQADHRNNMFIRYQLARAEEGAGNLEEARRLYGEVAGFNFNSVGFALVGREAKERAAG